MINENYILGVKFAAEVAGISRATIYNWAKKEPGLIVRYGGHRLVNKKLLAEIVATVKGRG